MCDETNISNMECLKSDDDDAINFLFSSSSSISTELWNATMTWDRISHI